MLILLAVGLSSMLFVLGAGARSTENMVGRRKAFYVCDGVGRLATIAAADYFARTAGTATSAGLKSHVQALGRGPLLPSFVAPTPGYVLQDFDIAAVGGRVLEPLSSGPFKGMMAAQDGVTLSFGAMRSSTGWMCRQEQSVTLGKIGMFQFFVFSDQPYTDWAPGPEMAATGRVHANGTLCIGAGNALWLDRVTAHGDIRHTSDGACRDGTGATDAQPVKVAFVDGANFDVNPPPANNDSIEPDTADFRNFGNGSRTATWASFALSEYGGRLLDAAHNVPLLRIPVFGAVSVQRGYDASAVSPSMMNPTTRILVDPVLSRDSADVKRQKLAYQADIRIINGVWYLRDRTNPDAWPGIAIWSDHAGIYTTTGEEGVEPANRAVGQNQLATSQGWSTRPKRYSYYRYNAAGDLTTSTSDPPAVISYGVLARDTGSGSAIWRPGVRCDGDGAIEAFNAPVLFPPTCDQTTKANPPQAAAITAPDSPGERLLRGTRSGFRSGHVDRFEQSRPLADRVRERANVIPINFDVAAFQHALATATTGELGAYFTAEPFNGIVWISSTWERSMMEPAADEPPPQGCASSNPPNPSCPPVDDANQPAVIKQKEDDILPTEKNIENQALVYPLCTGAGSGSLVNHAVFDAADGNKITGFKLPSCELYAGTGTMKAARPTALRIFNARNVNNAVDPRPDLTDATGTLPNGLTIATNLPVFVLGDVNVGSNPEDLTPSSPWVPVLVAGDVTHVLSNAWVDNKSRWSKSVNGGEQATETTLRMELVSGWTPTTNTPGQYSGGLENFPRFVEDWRNKILNIRGSFVVGWSTVYNRAPRQGSVYAAPLRDWGFDRHLEQQTKQPPGAPLLDVAAVRQWKR